MTAFRRAHAIMYHDVVDSDWDASGFPGRGAAVYKLHRQDFANHLDTIHAAIAPGRVQIVTAAEGPCPVLLTFDDGGSSAYSPTADFLERRSWRGHFFVTTGRIHTPGFLTGAQIRELDVRGHLIGSHSHSHPARMARLTRDEMLAEWRASLRALEDILGKPVKVASVPGGYYSRLVGETAAESGVRILFNSEPTAKVGEVDGCMLIGRYFVQRGMSPYTAAAFASGALGPRLWQAAMWKAKKAAKTAGGELYLKVRERLIR
ncbi:MAG: polysaccharide deacetylase family protein [Bryobacteraceae bacterium]